jgi:hypothetical protein
VICPPGSTGFGRSAGPGKRSWTTALRLPHTSAGASVGAHEQFRLVTIDNGQFGRSCRIDARKSQSQVNRSCEEFPGSRRIQRKRLLKGELNEKPAGCGQRGPRGGCMIRTGSQCPFCCALRTQRGHRGKSEKGHEQSSKTGGTSPNEISSTSHADPGSPRQCI